MCSLRRRTHVYARPVFWKIFVLVNAGCIPSCNLKNTSIVFSNEQSQDRQDGSHRARYLGSGISLGNGVGASRRVVADRSGGAEKVQ